MNTQLSLFYGMVVDIVYWVIRVALGGVPGGD